MRKSKTPIGEVELDVEDTVKLLDELSSNKQPLPIHTLVEGLIIGIGVLVAIAMTIRQWPF